MPPRRGRSSSVPTARRSTSWIPRWPNTAPTGSRRCHPENTGVSAHLVHGHSAAPDGWRYRMFYPSVELLRDAAGQLGGRAREIPFFGSPVIEDPELGRLLAAMHATLESGAPPLERQSRLLWALGQLILRH